MQIRSFLDRVREMHAQDGVKQSIFIVEGDTDWRHALREILVAEGYEVSTSRSRDDALEQFAEGQKPSLVISDLMMPGMQAEEFYSVMHRIGFGDVPMFVMSSADETEIPSPPGVQARFRKPVEVERLLEAIQKFR